MIGVLTQQGLLGGGRHFRLLFAASILAPLALFAAHAWQTNDSLFRESEDRLLRRAATLSEHVARVFDTQATVLELIIDRVAPLSTNDITHSRKLADWLSRRAAKDQMVLSIEVFDRDGAILAGSVPHKGPQVVVANDFPAALGSGGLVIGTQMRGREGDERGFILSRQWHGGVVGIGLSSRYFETIFVDGDDAGSAVTALYREDGELLVRVPVSVQLTDASGLIQRLPAAKEGVYQTGAAHEAAKQLYAFHQVGDYPVWVVNGMDMRDIRRASLVRLLPHALLTVLVMVLLSAAVLMAQRRGQRAAAAGQLLEQAVVDRTAEALEAMFARKEAMAEAERANRAKTHFLASASHDLRQPIQGVRLFLEVLDGRLEDRYNRHVLGSAVTALEGAESLLSTLLDVSTLEAGMIRTSLQPVSLSALLSDLAKEFRQQADKQGLEFTYVPCRQWVASDPVLLARILRNLLSNALRYTHTGRVLLGCRRQGNMIRVEVWDTGLGIPEDKLDAIFEDFVQVGNPERDRAKGLGLGLAVVRRMAALLGHKIGVQSSFGHGTVFWITLPITPSYSPLPPAA